MNEYRMKLLAFLLGCVAGMLLLLLVGAVFGDKANAQTRVNIPFPRETPGFVPKYTKDPSAWPISLIFLPPLLVMNAVAIKVETILEPTIKGSKERRVSEFRKATRNLRLTTAVMAVHAVRGAKRFHEGRVAAREARAYRNKARNVKCVSVGNWVGAPCQ